MASKILAADIGGTSSRIGLFEANGASLKKVESLWLRTKDYKSFDVLLAALRDTVIGPALGSCEIFSIAVAGPVKDGSYCKPPFIAWDIDLRDCRQAAGIKAYALINDFVAQAYACRSEIGKQALKVVDGEIDPLGAVAVIGAGTDLGKAVLLPAMSGGFTAMPSEGGHGNFAAENERELELAAFAAKLYDGRYAEWGDMVSGRGLSAIHAFLTGVHLQPQEIAAHFGEHPQTLEWFSRFYARACRNFALETLSTGGLYVTGGIAAKNPSILRHPAFAGEFKNPKRLKSVLERIAVFLIDNEESGLFGAGLYGALRVEGSTARVG